MKVRIFTEPHRGADYDAERDFARVVESCGFDGYFRADHYQSMGGSLGLPGPTDAWVTLGALARETTSMRLGTLVTSGTFRLPGPLAIIAAQVDQMSGGRIEFGFGAGWYQREHTSYGIPFPALNERFERLEEQLEIITGLWRSPAGHHFTYRGKHYELQDAPALPKPAQAGGPPVIIGGRGPRRTPRIAVQFADEFNSVFQGPKEAAVQFQRIGELIEELGRPDEWPLTLSSGLVVACGRTDAEAKRREAAMYESSSALPSEDPVVGGPNRVVERIGELADVGAERIYLRLGDMSDFDHLELVAQEVLPQVR